MKKVYSIFLAIVMMFAMATTAWAATTDPNMTVYDTPYTTILEPSTSNQVVDLMASPANDAYEATFFDTASDASEVEWTVFTDGVAIDAPTVMDPVQIDENQFVAWAEVTVPSTMKQGTISVMATNPNSDSEKPAYISYTIVVNGDEVTVAKNVLAKFYNGNELLLTTPLMDVSVNDHHSSTGTEIKFADVLDSIYRAKTATTGMPNALTACDTSYDYLSSLTFAKTGLLSAAGNDGWQYRVYDTDNKIIPLSEYVGAEDFMLKDGYTIIWKYGAYGVEFDKVLQ